MAHNSQLPPPSRHSVLPPPARPPHKKVLGWFTTFVQEFGEINMMLGGAIRAIFQRPFEMRELLRQFESIGVASMTIVTVTSVFIGMVMSTQFAFGLQKFGGMEYTSRVVGLSFARELAPTFTAIIVGGRICAGMTAELGAMAVTEQVDAIQALGADPVKKLVMPRLVAAIIAMPLLGSFSLVLGFSGAMFITDWQFNIPAAEFLSSALQTVTMMDYLAGAVKMPFFGTITAIVGCYYGLKTRGGTAGVGKATTHTVVVSAISMLIADFFLTKCWFILWKLFA